MTSRAGMLARIRHVFGIFSRKETPRDLQERNDLYMAILASTHKRLRLEKIAGSEWVGVRAGPMSGLSPSLLSEMPSPVPSSALSAPDTTLGAAASNQPSQLTGILETREVVEELVDKATEVLSTEMEAHTKPIMGLRFELQNMLAPELFSIFEAFKDVDMSLPPSASDSDAEWKEEDDEVFKSLLLQEYDIVCRDLGTAEEKETKVGVEIEDGKPKENGSTPRPGPLPYLRRKQGALQTVLSFKGWSDTSRYPPLSAETSNDVEAGDTIAPRKSDDFGYYADPADDEVNEAIRHHQIINLTKSALLREKLGFSVLALRSTVPGAGRGIFVDGTARAGSILAFFPGEVWPKEHLVGTAVNSVFKEDNNYQLSIRYDDILIDSRQAPYTVLNHSGSNPWAIAHIANHPPPFSKLNCRTVFLNFTQKMKLKPNSLSRYIPNTYARQPMMLGQKALDRDVITMHGFGLMAARDVCNEELFYDYRLSPGPNGIYPDWYHICDKEEHANRWYRKDEN